MSVYKEPIEWLRQSIDSMLNQTFKDFEFIIICDNPEYEDGINLLKDYLVKDKRIILLCNDKNIGLTKSLNKCLSVSKGEYIARMDADDIAYPTRLEKQLALMEKNPDVDVCGTNILKFGGESRVVSYPEKMDNIYLFIESPFAHPTVVIRKKSLKNFRYNEEFRVSQDFKLWVDMYEKGAVFYNLQETLLKYRVSDKQISTNVLKNKEQRLISCSLRRKAFDIYCKNNEINNPIQNGDIISYEIIQEIKRLVNIPDIYMKQFIFFLYCSLDEKWYKIIWYLIKSNDIWIMNFKDSLRVIKYSVFKIEYKKF